MLHGDFLQAVQLNVLFVAFSPLVLFMLGDLVYCMVSRCKVSPHLSVSAAGGWWLLGVFVGYTILRNLPYFPFTCLAPH